MLNTRNDRQTTVFYSFLACFLNTFRLNIRIHVTYRVNQAEYGIHIRVGCATGRRKYLFITYDPNPTLVTCAGAQGDRRAAGADASRRFGLAP